MLPHEPGGHWCLTVVLGIWDLAGLSVSGDVTCVANVWELLNYTSNFFYKLKKENNSGVLWDFSFFICKIEIVVFSSSVGERLALFSGPG